MTPSTIVAHRAAPPIRGALIRVGLVAAGAAAAFALSAGAAHADSLVGDLLGQTTKTVTQAAKPVTKPLAKTVSQAAKPVAKVAKPVTKVARPVTKVAKPVTQAKPVTKPVAQAAKPIAKSVAQPVTKITTSLTKPLTKVVKPLAAAVTKPAPTTTSRPSASTSPAKADPAQTSTGPGKSGRATAIVRGTTDTGKDAAHQLARTSRTTDSVLTDLVSTTYAGVTSVAGQALPAVTEPILTGVDHAVVGPTLATKTGVLGGVAAVVDGTVVQVVDQVVVPVVTPVTETVDAIVDPVVGPVVGVIVNPNPSPVVVPILRPVVVPATDLPVMLFPVVTGPVGPLGDHRGNASVPSPSTATSVTTSSPTIGMTAGTTGADRVAASPAVLSLDHDPITATGATAMASPSRAGQPTADSTPVASVSPTGAGLLGLTDQLGTDLAAGAASGSSAISGGSGTASASALAIMFLGLAALLAATLVTRTGRQTGWILAYRPSFSPD